MKNKSEVYSLHHQKIYVRPKQYHHLKVILRSKLVIVFIFLVFLNTITKFILNQQFVVKLKKFL